MLGMDASLHDEAWVRPAAPNLVLEGSHPTPPPPTAQEVYGGCKRVFSVLPLAACVASTALVLHGGLFRKPNPPTRARQKRRSAWWFWQSR